MLVHIMSLSFWYIHSYLYFIYYSRQSFASLLSLLPLKVILSCSGSTFRVLALLVVHVLAEVV